MRKFVFVLLSFFMAAVFSSCSKIMGYGVLLWNIPEKQLSDGEVVPVYIRSNITQVYVIGAGREKGEKIEIPLWQITEPVSKGKAFRIAKKYSEYRYTYANVVLDGLPMRSDPVNTAKQVYRLRKGEVIKVLYKGKGQTVSAGSKVLEGDWLRVLASDGTVGWCFSYNLRTFKTDLNGMPIENAETDLEEDFSQIVEELLSDIWYPEYYKSMILSGRINIEKLIPSYNLNLDTENRELYFAMPNINQTWEFFGAERDSIDKNVYKLNDIPIQITVRSPDFIIVRYTGISGKPQDFNLVKVEADIKELVNAENERRLRILEQIYMFGPVFKSSNYGTLSIGEDNSFIWNNYNLLIPAIVSRNAGNKGFISIKYFLNSSLSFAYDGVLTFQFDSMQKELNFLYKMEGNGLRLEDASGAVFKDGVLTERGLSPLVLFFSTSN